MISIEQALEIINGNQPPALTCSMELSDAPGLVLAEDVAAPEPLPRYTDSAMDGFAVRWSDFERGEEGATVTLSVIGESRAGEPFRAAVQAGEAVRISTGAVLPAGTDTVVPVEDVEEEGQRISVQSMVMKQQYVRFEGEEIQAGETVLERGSRLTPAGLGLLASIGVGTVTVFRPPTTAVVVTGSELVASDDEIQPWQSRESNGIMLAAAVYQSGGEVTFSDHCGDQLEATKRAINSAFQAAQILLISGGVSVGPHDLVKQAAQEEGFEPLFWKVRQKPGKPLFFARKADRLLFGLPGNSVSALNCYVFYVHPVLQKMQGIEFNWDILTGTLAEEVENRGERSFFLRVQIIESDTGMTRVIPIRKQGAHMLSSMTLADGFLLLEPGQKLPEGEEVRVHLYPWRR